MKKLNILQHLIQKQKIMNYTSTFLKQLFAVVAMLFICSFSIAQKIDQTFLPKGFAPGEKEKMKEYLENRNNQRSSTVITTPPTGSAIRTMSEWEEVQALVIVWTSYLPVHREIIKAVQNETPVIIVCSDSNTVKSNLTSNGVALTNLSFLIAPFNSVWIRDYMANSVYTNNVDSLVLVDWIYNRPRPKDDTLARSIANYMNIPLYETSGGINNLINVGGNYMTDGFGNDFSSNLVLDENPTQSSTEIGQIMNNFMGTGNYIKMNTLPYDGIHHIDMHMKLLDEETLLIGEYPAGVADGPQIEANLQYVLSNHNSVFGTPFKIIRIPMPPEPGYDYPPNSYYYTYANNSIVNKTILMPTYPVNATTPSYHDTIAIRIMQEAMPGYNVVGINTKSTISASGSLHCITHSIGVTHPLLIKHQALPNTTNSTIDYSVEAKIMHKSGISAATMYYRTDISQAFVSVSMTLLNPLTDNWTANIPAQIDGTIIHYYIQAQAVTGKQQVRPITAPTGYYTFEVYQPLNIEEMTSAVDFKNAYPNPSKGITCIPVQTLSSVKGSIKLFDIAGREIATIFEGEFTRGNSNYFINTQEISSGAYLLILQQGEVKQAQKLMIR